MAGGAAIAHVFSKTMPAQTGRRHADPSVSFHSRFPASTCVLCGLLEQPDEARLLEMVIRRNRLGESTLLHDHEA